MSLWEEIRWLPAQLSISHLLLLSRAGQRVALRAAGFFLLFSLSQPLLRVLLGLQDLVPCSISVGVRELWLRFGGRARVNPQVALQQFRARCNSLPGSMMDCQVN